MIDPRLLADLSPDQIQQALGLMQQKQFADSMTQQALAPHPTEMVSGRAVPQSMLANIARALTIGGGMSQSNSFDQQANKLVADATADTQKQLAGLYADPNPNSPATVQAMARALSSPNPKVQAAAAQLFKTRQELLVKWADLAGKTDAPLAAGAVATGTIPATGVPQPKAPQVSPVTIGNTTYPLVTNTGEGGVLHGSITTPPAISNTNINMPGEVGKIVAADVENELKTRGATADAGRALWNQAQLATEALQAGAQAGGGQETFQAARKIYQLFGGKPEDLTPTTDLQMALGTQILSHAREVAPVTQTDLQELKGIYGSINSDPAALSKMLTVVSAAAFKAMHGLHDYVGEVSRNAEAVGKDPRLTGPALQAAQEQAAVAKNLIAGKLIGREAPTELFGPTAFQLAIVDRLKKGGFDISRLGGNLPGIAARGTQAAVPGGPGTNFEPDAQFAIKNPGADFPAVSGKTPGQVDRLKWEKLSPEEKAAILEFLQKSSQRGGQ